MAVAFLLFAANVRAVRSFLTSDEIPARPPRKRKWRRYQDYLPRRVTAPPASPAA